jgi:hypothetical protein
VIPLILAQAAPELLKAWLEVLAWLVGFCGGCIWIWTMVRPHRDPVPQPLEVKSHTAIASQGDVDQIHGRIKRERFEIEESIRQLREEDRRIREKLDNEIKELRDHIDGVPERTIALLRNTKGLIE